MDDPTTCWVSPSTHDNLPKAKRPADGGTAFGQPAGGGMSAQAVGQQLQQARTAAGLSLRDITNTTKIQTWVLQELEAGRLLATMSPIYVKGFVNTYAKHLGLDPAPMIARLFPPPAPAAELSNPEPQPQLSTAVTPAVSLPRIPAVRLPRMKIRIEWDRVWDAAERLWPFAKRIGIGAAGLAVLVALVKINPLEKVSTRVAHKQASLAVADKPAAAKPSAEAVLRVHPSQPLELVLMARQPTWVSVKVDGRLVAQRQLNAGAKETWTARRQVDLIVARPAFLEALLNGQSIHPLLMAHGGRLAITHKSIAPLVANATPE